MIWKKGPWNTWPWVSWATIVPRVLLVAGVQVKVAPMFCPTTWPVPTPNVVQPAAASAINEAPASLIENVFIVLLLDSLPVMETANSAIRSHG